MASNPSSRFTRVEIVTMRPMPASAARATMASRSGAKSGKSRWQWLSTSMEFYLCRRRLDVTGEDCLRRRQHCAGRNPRMAAKRCKHPCLALRDTKAIEQLFGGRRQHRLGQDRDLPDHLGSDIEHRVLARGFGLRQCPGRLPCEIAV